MFLKGFKEKSNQKFIEKILAKPSAESSHAKIKSVGILLNHVEFSNYEVINGFLNDLNIIPENRKTLTFLTVKDLHENSMSATFTAKDFGWRGKLKNSAIRDFTKTKFDVLICYFLGDDTELKQIAAMSEAEFKVGISNLDERLYNLIINVDIRNFDNFKTELKKYLTILNKI